jgi:acyl-CoA thioesterase I
MRRRKTTICPSTLPPLHVMKFCTLHSVMCLRLRCELLMRETINDPVRVFFFGDSICFGQGVSIHKGWVTRISASLGALSQELGRQVLLMNASISGNTTRMALERMPYDIQSQNPDVLIVQFGMNDCNYWETDRGNPRVSPAAFRANLMEIIARGYTFGCRRVLLNTNHPTGRDQSLMPHTTITYQESNERYNETIRSVAQELGDRVVLNDVEAAFRTHINGSADTLRSLLLPAPDLLHLSETGHDLYYDLVFPQVRAAVVEVAASNAAELCEVSSS